MPKLGRACITLIVYCLLSQVAAQAPLWRLNVRLNEPTPSVYGPRIANDEVRIFFLQEGQVKAVDAATGTLLWTFHVGAGAQLEYGSGILVAITRQGKIFALEPATGEVRWSRTMKFAGVYAIANKTLYIAAVERLSAVNLETGNMLWSNHVTLFSFSPFEPFTVANKRIFIYSVGGDVVMSATTYFFDEQTGKTLGRADTHGPLAITQGEAFFENDWINLDKPDDVLIDVHSLQTGKRLEQRTYTVENHNVPEGAISGSLVRMDSHAVYISGGGNIACFPLSSPKRKAKPDFIRVPRGEVKWVAGPYRGAFVLEWQQAVWAAKRRNEKPCSPIALQADGYKLAAGRVAHVTSLDKNLYVGLKSGAFFAVDLEFNRITLRLNLPTSAFGETRVVADRLIVQTGAELLAFPLP